MTRGDDESLRVFGRTQHYINFSAHAVTVMSYTMSWWTPLPPRSPRTNAARALLPPAEIQTVQAVRRAVREARPTLPELRRYEPRFVHEDGTWREHHLAQADWRQTHLLRTMDTTPPSDVDAEVIAALSQEAHARWQAQIDETEAKRRELEDERCRTIAEGRPWAPPAPPDWVVSARREWLESERAAAGGRLRNARHRWAWTTPVWSHLLYDPSEADELPESTPPTSRVVEAGAGWSPPTSRGVQVGSGWAQEDIMSWDQGGWGGSAAIPDPTFAWGQPGPPRPPPSWDDLIAPPDAPTAAAAAPAPAPPPPAPTPAPALAAPAPAPAPRRRPRPRNLPPRVSREMGRPRSPPYVEGPLVEFKLPDGEGFFPAQPLVYGTPRLRYEFEHEVVNRAKGDYRVVVDRCKAPGCSVHWPCRECCRHPAAHFFLLGEKYLDCNAPDLYDIDRDTECGSLFDPLSPPGSPGRYESYESSEYEEDEEPRF
ncbi:hypothetical protein EXIGLDRAFT_777619 [Exidia glandulosa HHB12029]|uniref:Uncharacterized protein n=1 Tax=Exidia glandulosa HHB12029 TaxID=1314781 RepID=A0A165CXS5_EXIGL|nr:hypothetical protein EXIGLDRAFT_777619 [Exidia glandulosa HHB12029]